MYLPISKAEGQCYSYDTAAIMRGRHCGIATQLAYEEPRAVYMYCYGHTIKSACDHSYIAMKDSMDVMYTKDH